MFGRRKTPFGSPPPSPPPPGGKEPWPIDKMDRAMDAAIRLFTRALDQAGVDAGGLSIRGEVPENVTSLVADCTSYRGEADGGMSYLTLGITPDLKAFSYPPHCRLFMILNSVGICEDPAARSILTSLAPEQFPAPLIDAHFLRRWVRYILPTGKAMQESSSALERMMQAMLTEFMEVVRATPEAWAKRIDLRALFEEWGSGFPGVIGRPLDDQVQRMNGLPVTPFIADTLTRFLAELQMRGLSDRP